MAFEPEWPPKTADKYWRVADAKAANVLSFQLVENNQSPPRLRTRQDFRRVQEQGHTVAADKWLVVCFAANHKGALRVGWTLPRYVGNAVIRNRLKRWMRNDLRDLSGVDKSRSLDINFLFRNRGPHFYKEMSHDSFKRTLKGAIEKLDKSRRPSA